MVSEDLSKSNEEIIPTPEQVEQKYNEYVALLPAEIRRHLIEDQLLGLTLDHPMCFLSGIPALAVSGSFPADQITKSVRWSEQKFKEQCAFGDFDGALFLVSKRYKREYLLELIRKHGAAKLLDAVNSVWVGVDYFHDYHDLWEEVWDYVVDLGEARLGVMDADERAFLDTLPDTLIVHRGFRGEGGEFGWSWTLDQERAKWFARRWSGGASMVATTTVPKNEVLAYFNSRNESEIVVHPNYLDCCAEIEIEALDEEWKAA